MKRIAIACALLGFSACTGDGAKNDTPKTPDTPAKNEKPAAPASTVIHAEKDSCRVTCDLGKNVRIEQPVPTGGHGLVLDSCRHDQGVAILAITLRAPAKDAVVTQATATLELDIPWAKANPQDLRKVRIEKRTIRDGEHYFVEPRHETLLEIDLPK